MPSNTPSSSFPDFIDLTSEELKVVLQKHKIGLTPEEARKIRDELGRALTLTEAILWGIQGSEHCSYKSSRRYLNMLPTKAPNVILGPGEDAGVVEITKIDGDRFGLIVSHESHNHPSQIVPYEGAATGIGGCVRDTVCMGGKVIGVMDPLRFGNLKENQQRQITEGAIAGIAGYGNPIGVPNLGGDVYFDDRFNDNCLVNVVTMGVLRESELIHSFVPPEAADEAWDIIVIGKPTDFSGMGGASFSSGMLDENEKEANKGAVQEPNPFLKRHLLVSTYDLFKLLKAKGFLAKVSFKDMGAGGITCSTVEQVAKKDLGALIDLEQVHTAFPNMPPEVIACAETQERFTWMCHPSVSELILKHYNETWDLPSISEKAGARKIGKVAKGNYVLMYKGQKVVDAPAKLITEALSYDRPFQEGVKNLTEPTLPSPQDYQEILFRLLASENIASRKPIYEKYDKQVQGYTVLEAGVADASVVAPLIDEDIPEEFKKVGMAFSTDSNPRYSIIDPFWGAANAVVESMRNTAAVGAYPQALTNCLNYGNPEKPDQMYELKRGIEGLAAACEGVGLKNYPGSPTPIISGNVSLYNEGKNGHVPPSAIICCMSKIDDVSKAITQQLKRTGSHLYLLGKRKRELGGSEYYRLYGELGANLPLPNFAEVQKEIFTLTDAIDQELVLSAHDISEGGLAITLAEMAFGGWGEGRIGIEVDLDLVPDFELEPWVKLFSETGGFVLEVAPEKNDAFVQLCEQAGLPIYRIGSSTESSRLVFQTGAQNILNVEVAQAAHEWLHGLRDKL